MDIDKALKLFNINDLMNEDKASIKKKYRKLMLKYHPDNCNGDERKAQDVSLAYEILGETLEKLTKYKAITQSQQLMTIVIPLNKLINLYDGKVETLKVADKIVDVDKKILKKNNALIIIEASIYHNGIAYSFSNIEPWNITDNYEVNCDIIVNDIFDEEEIIVKVGKNEKNIKMKSQSLKLVMKIEHNISVNVIINKKIKVDNS
jgi:hypothetical protein